MCQAKCKLKCHRFMQFDVLLKFRESFWGEMGTKAPNAATKRLRIAKEIATARRQYTDHVELHGRSEVDDSKNNLLFMIDGEAICEKAFVNILGLADSNGQKSKMWNHEVSKFFGW